MDPLSVVGTVLTIVQIAQSIKASIDKVAGNKKRLQDLINDIVHGIDNLEKFTKRHGEILNGSSELRDALSRLQTEMSLLLIRCQKLLPRSNGSQMSKVKAKVKTWHKRDDIEAQMNQMKERILACYSQFTAFTAARVEHVSTRIENSLVVRGIEHNAHLTRLEVLMTTMLLDSRFGQQIVQQVGRILATDFSHHSVEHDYLRLQLDRVVESIQTLPGLQSAAIEQPSSRHEVPFEPCYQTAVAHETVVSEVLTMSRKIRERPYNLSVQDGAAELQDIAIYLNDLNLVREAIVLQKLVVRMYRNLVAGNSRAFFPRLAHALKNLSTYQQNVGDIEESLTSSKSSVAAFRMIVETYPDLDFRALLAFGLRTHSDGLRFAGHYETAIPFIEESVGIYLNLTREIGLDSSVNTPNYTTIYAGARACFAYCQALMDVQRYGDAYSSVKEGMQLLALLPAEEVLRTPLRNTPLTAFRLVFLSLVAVYETKATSLSLAEDVIIIYRVLAQVHPTLFSDYFLRTFYAYTYLCDLGQASNTSSVELGEHQIDVFRSIFEDEIYTNAADERTLKSFHPCINQLQQNTQGVVVISDAITVYLTLQSDPCFPTPSLTTNVHLFIVALFQAHFEVALDSVHRATTHLLALKGDHHYLYTRILSCLRDVSSVVNDALKSSILPLALELIESARTNHDDQDLAAALNIYGYILVNCGNQTNGMKTVEESITLYRSVIFDSPHRQSDYMSTLMEYANFLCRAGKPGEALTFHHYALVQCVESMGEQPSDEPFNTAYTTSLAQVSECFFLLGYYDQVAILCCEAVEAWASFVPVPSLFPSPLFIKMARNFLRIGRHHEALSLSERILTVCAQTSSLASAPQMEVYGIMARCHQALGDNEKVVEFIDKACGRCKEDTLTEPIDWTLPGLSYEILALLSSHAASVSRIDDALSFARSAVQCYSKTGSRELEPVATYVDALCEVAASVWNSGRQDDALALLDGIAFSQFTTVMKDGNLHICLQQTSHERDRKHISKEDLDPFITSQLLVTLDKPAMESGDLITSRPLDASFDPIVQNIIELLPKRVVDAPSPPVAVDLLEERLASQSGVPVMGVTETPNDEMEIPLSPICNPSPSPSQNQEDMGDPESTIASHIITPDHNALKNPLSNVSTDIIPSCLISPAPNLERDAWVTLKHGLSMFANFLVIFWTLAVVWNSLQASAESRVSILDRIAAATSFR